ncbi:MAG: PQQ-binding-like beta-propeller repeat protein [Acidimicrobiales bacterium]|nr:PQQ-binding-like beta-propeller repeat protein [Acidimicrobiales bacterium]
MRRLVAVGVAGCILAGCGGDAAVQDGGITLEVPIEDGESLQVDIPAENPEAVVVDIGVQEPSAPVAVGDRVVYVEGNSLLVSLEPRGRDVVTRDLPGDIVGVLGDAVVVTSGGSIHLLDGATLETRLTLPTPEDATGLRAVAVDPAGRYIVAGYDNAYAAFSGTDGSMLFSGPMQPVRNAAVRGETAAMAVELDDGTTGAFTFDPATGTPTGDVVLGEAIAHELVDVVGTNQILVTEDGDSSEGGPGGSIYVVDTTTRSDVWRVDAGSFFDEPLVLDAVVAAPNQDDTILRIDIATGESSAAPTRSRVAHAPVLHDGRVVMVNEDAEVLVMDATTGELLAEPLVLPDVDQIHGWALVGDVLYVTATERQINVDDDPDRLFGVDLTILAP